MNPLFIIYMASIVVSFFLTALADFDYVLTPKNIYDDSEMNWFGCVLLFIFFVFTNPLSYLLWLVYMALHVGRKEK